MQTKTKQIISILMILSFALSAIMLQHLPTTSSQTNGAKATFSYVGAVPNPVNVGGEVLIHLGITDAMAGVNNGWQGLT